MINIQFPECDKFMIETIRKAEEVNLLINNMMEYIYEQEVIDTGMKPLVIGDGKEFSTKEEWTEHKLMEFKS